MTDDKNVNQLLPIKNKEIFHRRLESAKSSILAFNKYKLQLNMCFNYQQAIGELIFLLVTCDADISYPLINLGQYRPVQEHYEAVKQIFLTPKPLKQMAFTSGGIRTQAKIAFHLI